MKNQNKSTKRVFFDARLGPLKEYLEDMALQGWKLTGSNFFLCFERIEPQKLYYSIEVPPKISFFGNAQSPETEEWLEYCRAGGWQFVCSWGTTYIFVSDSPDTVPIETDEGLKLQAWKQSQLRYMIPILCLFSLALLLNASDFLALDFATEVRTNFASFFVAYLLPIMLVLFFLFAVCGVLVQTAIQKRRLKNGLPLELPHEKKQKPGKVRYILSIALSAAFLLALLFLSIAANGLSTLIFLFVVIPILIVVGHYTRKRKYSRKKLLWLLVLGAVALGAIAGIITSLLGII